MPHPADNETSLMCQTSRHARCSWDPGHCPCPCHQQMTHEYAAALILRLAGHRLWPDDRDAQLALVDTARSADPFHPELDRALATLGLS